MKQLTNSIPVGKRQDHGVPYRYVAVSVNYAEEDAGQGYRPPFPLVAMLNVETHAGEQIEVAIGGEKNIDALINALNVMKIRMQVDAKTKELDSLKGCLIRTEADLLGVPEE